MHTEEVENGFCMCMLTDDDGWNESLIKNLLKTEACDADAQTKAGYGPRLIIVQHDSHTE